MTYTKNFLFGVAILAVLAVTIYGWIQLIKDAGSLLGAATGETITERGQSRTVVVGAASSIASPAGNWRFRSFCSDATSTIWLAMGPNATSGAGIALRPGISTSSAAQSCVVFDDRTPYNGRVSVISNTTSSNLSIEEK